MPEITLLQRSQVDQSVRVLTAAFADDVMWKGILPDAAERNRVMPTLWRGVVAYCQRYGIVSTMPDVEGIAAWASPGHAHPTLWKQIRTGFLLSRSVMLMSKESRNRFLRIMKQIDVLHRQVMPQPHWYLWALGVDPAHQGRGIGRSLLEPAFARARDAGFACYLETQTESNVGFYRKQGFDLLHEAEFPEANLQLWFMHKPAQRTSVSRSDLTEKVELMNKKLQPTGTVLETVIVFTSRMNELAEFYRIGLRIGPYQESPQHLGCRVGSIYFGFDQIDDESAETSSRLGPTIWFTVDDIQTNFDRLVKLGATIRYPPTKKPWGAVLASLEDPDGNVFGIAQRMGRSE